MDDNPQLAPGCSNNPFLVANTCSRWHPSVRFLPTILPGPPFVPFPAPLPPPQVIPRERRTQLFSATMTNKVAKLQRACLVKPVKVEVAHKYSTVDTLRQQYLFVPAKYKDCYLAFVLNELSGSTFMVGVGRRRGKGGGG